MPNKRADNMRAFSITEDVTMLALVDTYCEDHRISRTEFYRLACAYFLKAQKIAGATFSLSSEENKHPRMNDAQSAGKQ